MVYIVYFWEATGRSDLTIAFKAPRPFSQALLPRLTSSRCESYLGSLGKSNLDTSKYYSRPLLHNRRTHRKAAATRIKADAKNVYPTDHMLRYSLFLSISLSLSHSLLCSISWGESLRILLILTSRSRLPIARRARGGAGGMSGKAQDVEWEPTHTNKEDLQLMICLRNHPHMT